MGAILGVPPFLLHKTLGIPVGILIIVLSFIAPQDGNSFLGGLISVAEIFLIMGFVFYAIGAWSEKSMERKNEKERQASRLGGKLIWYLSHFLR